MKLTSLLLIACSCAALAAEKPKFAKLTTKSGKTYEAVTVMSVKPDSIFIMHRDGGRNIKVEDLSADLQKELGIELDDEAKDYRAKANAAKNAQRTVDAKADNARRKLKRERTSALYIKDAQEKEFRRTGRKPLVTKTLKVAKPVVNYNIIDGSHIISPKKHNGISIAYGSLRILYVKYKKECEVELSEPMDFDKYVEINKNSMGGMIRVDVKRLTIGSANASSFKAVILDENSNVIQRESFKHDSPELPGTDRMWWNSIYFNLEDDFDRELTIRIVDRVGVYHSFSDFTLKKIK